MLNEEKRKSAPFCVLQSGDKDWNLGWVEETPAFPSWKASGQEARKSILDLRWLGWFMHEASCLAHDERARAVPNARQATSYTEILNKFQRDELRLFFEKNSYLSCNERVIEDFLKRKSQ